MSKNHASNRINRLNKRQQKKLKVGEYQEFVVEMEITLNQPLNDEGYETFWTDFITYIESQKWSFGGGYDDDLVMGGAIHAPYNATPLNAETLAELESFLKKQSVIKTVQFNKIEDAWYVEAVAKQYT